MTNSNKNSDTQENSNVEPVTYDSPVTEMRHLIGEPHNKPIILNKARLETLTDGVFAIVMTLLVIELHVPVFEIGEAVTNQKLMEKLEDLIPNVLAYFLSFAILSMFWLSHHFVFHKHTKNIDRIISHLNNVYLSFLALIPFSTGLLAHYYNQSIAVAIYGLNILFVSLFNSLMVIYIWRAVHIDNGVIPSRVKTQARIRIGSIVLTSLLGIILSPFYPMVSLGLYIFAVIFNVLPGTLTFVEQLFGFKIK